MGLPANFDPNKEEISGAEPENKIDTATNTIIETIFQNLKLQVNNTLKNLIKKTIPSVAEQIGPTPAARLVARAWMDADFKHLALTDPLAASKQVGVDWLEPTGFGTPSDFVAFKILANTPTIHHVIVCALCSCYPRPILGNSPEWYRTPNYRRRIVRWPRQVLSEFGLVLPDDVEVRVEDSNQKHRFMVMPLRPEGTDGWTEDQLTEIITRDCLIGVALPTPGVTTNVITKTRPAIRPIVG
jgi:nitrile hydratase